MSINLIESIKDYLKIGIIGEFNAGKSSLINALLNENILPTDIFPTTATVNCIAYDIDKNIKVFSHDENIKIIEEDNLDLYNAENGDFDNISHIFIKHPNAVKDIVFIDTPGFNDPNENRDKLIRYILPSLDCILFISDVNQPLKASEIPFLKSNYTQSLFKRTFFIFNHCDSLNSLDELYKTEKYIISTLEKIFVEQTMKDKNNEKTDFFREKIFYTCLDKRSLTLCTKDLKTYIENNFTTLRSNIEKLSLNKKLILKESQNIFKINSFKDKVLELNNRILLIDNNKDNIDKYKFDLISSMEKISNNINNMNKNILLFKENNHKLLENMKVNILKKIRATTSNRNILSNQYLLEIEIKKILQLHIEDLIESFTNLSIQLLGESILISQNDFINIDSVSLVNPTEYYQNLNTEKMLERNRNQTILQGSYPLVSHVAGIMLSSIIGPYGFLIGAVVANIIPSLEYESYRKELEFSAEKGINNIIFDIENHLSEIYKKISEKQYLIIKKVESNIIKCVIKKEWEIIHLSEGINENSIDIKNHILKEINKLNNEIDLLSSEINI